jgi:tetratricopeptide (TPR) repeat protein
VLRFLSTGRPEMIKVNRNFVIFSLLFSLIISVHSYAAIPVHRSDITKEAEIVSVRGDSWVRFVKEKDWYSALIMQVLTSGDALKTGAYGKLDVLFIDGTQIKVHNKTILVIKDVRKPTQKKGTILGLEVGEIWSRAKSVPEGLTIETPSATAAIRGTDWDIVVDKKGTSYLTVLKGTVELFNNFGKVIVDTGEQAMAEIDKPPVKMFLVRPKDRVQWIISYPLELDKIIPFYSHRRNEVMKFLPSVRERVKKDPSDVKARLLLAGLLFDVRKMDESIRLFDEILKSDPDNGRALTFKGLILLSNGEIDNSLSYLENALKTLHGREKTEALLGMAGVHLYKNEIGQTEKILEDIKQTDISPVVGVAIASFKAFLGDFLKAVEICSDYAKRYPDDERFPTMAADFYLTLDESTRAKEFVDIALKTNPDSSMAYAILGRYHYLEGRAEEAELSYRKSIELDPVNADALTELGNLLMEKGHYEESLEELTKATEVNPRGHSYWSNKGMLLNWVEDIRKAKKDFENAIDLNPVDYKSLDGLGFIALKEGKTEEAIQYFLQASLLEPRFAEPHLFLAIAYYQLEDFNRALDELDIAKTLDTKDPLPHIIAYLIYQDTYHPFDSITEAEKALELLPNLKSVNPVETTQKGLTNLGSAFLGLGLTEWGTSYAEESFNPYDASSYYFVSQKYEGNPFIFVSQNTLGFLLNPISIRYSDRYQDIVPYPQHNLEISTTLGDEDGGFSRRHEIVQHGYFRKPWEMSYLISLENYENEGYRENGYSRGNFLTLAFGGRPDYKNGFMIWAGIKGDKYGDPGPFIKPDSDDTLENSVITLSAGYNHRFGYNNNLLVNFSYSGINQKFRNSDPLGSTGLSDLELSFINRFGLDQSMSFFEKGVYDTGLFHGMNVFATDSTGTLQFLGLSPISYSITPFIDDNILRSENLTYEDMGFQIRHLFDIGKNHQFTYGLEYVPKTRFEIKDINSISQTDDTIVFIDDIFLYGLPYFMYEMEYSDSESKYLFDSETKIAYIADRWIPSDNLRIDIGIFYENFKQSNTIDNTSTDYDAIHPRVGFELKLGRKHILRAAYQKHLYSGTSLSLAPLATAGLFYEWIQLNPGARITDYQISLESRWTDKLFTEINTERRDFQKVEFDEKNHTYILSAAINSILTDRIGFFMRYKYTDSKNKNGLYEDKTLPLLPKHAFGTGFVCVLPSYIKAALSTYYIADLYGDPENTYKMPNFWVTDFTATWEPLKKHLMFKLVINNLFNENYEIEQLYPAAGRSVYLTAEYRF